MKQADERAGQRRFFIETRTVLAARLIGEAFLNLEKKLVGNNTEVLPVLGRISNLLSAHLP